MCSDEKVSAVETTVQTHKLWDRSTQQQPVVLKLSCDEYHCEEYTFLTDYIHVTNCA